MKAILILNAGSSSLKFALFPMTPRLADLPQLSGQVEGIGAEPLMHAKDTHSGERFTEAPSIRNGCVRVAAEDYLDAAGAKFVARFPATAWLRLSESIDLHEVDPAQVAVPTLVIAVEGDRLVPLSDAVTLVEGLGLNGRLRVLRSQYGHDAFLKEADRIDNILVAALRDADRNENGAIA